MTSIAINNFQPHLEPNAYHEDIEDVQSGSFLGITNPVYQMSIGYLISPLVGDIKRAFTAVLINKPFEHISKTSLKGITSTVLQMPTTCISGPVLEELFFRGFLHELLRKAFSSFYEAIGLEAEQVKTFAKISTVFFSAIIFGAAHFLNAYSLGCSFIEVLPQVVYSSVAGVLYGFLKEHTGNHFVAIGLHVGNNVDAWSSQALQELAKLAIKI